MKLPMILLAILFLLPGAPVFATNSQADPSATAAKEAEDIEKQASKMVEQLQQLGGSLPASEQAAPPPAAPAPVAPSPHGAPHAPAPGNAPVDGDLLLEQQQAPPNMAEAFAALAAAGNKSSMGVYQQKVFQLVSNEKFLKTAAEVWNHPNRTTVMIYQVGFFFMMLVVRAWQQARWDHWFPKALVAMACTVISWAGIIYFLPRIILGTAFRDLVRMIMDVLF